MKAKRKPRSNRVASDDGLGCACGKRKPHMQMELHGIWHRIWWVGCEPHGMFNCGGGDKSDALREYRRILRLAKMLGTI